MTDTFNAYHKWLGIPPKDQPPNHYRLLGVELFEADEDVISAAADQRMVFLRSFQAGKQAAAAEALLNEISAARVCLLSPERREIYDRELRAKSSTLPAPRPMTPGAAQHEQQLASTRAAAHDTARIVVTDTQEVALAPAPLPGKAATPPPRSKSGALPIPSPAVPAVAIPQPLATKPLPRAANFAEQKPPVAAPSAAANFFEQLPQHLLAAFSLLMQSPVTIALWLLRTADRALLRMVGEENRILFNFLRVVVPVVLLLLVAIGGFFGLTWGVPRIAVALRDRAAQRQREAESQRTAARPAIVDEFVMHAEVESPTDNSPPPVLPPDVPAEILNTPLDSPVGVVETPVVEEKDVGLLNPPTYTIEQLRGQIAAVASVESLLDTVLDTASPIADREARSFEYRQAMRDLAHTYTFARDASSSDWFAVGRIVTRANNTAAKQQFFASRTLEELKRVGPNSPGVVVCGKKKPWQVVRGVYQVPLEIDGERPTTVYVFSSDRLDDAFDVDDRIIVVGALIDQPRARIDGYQGSDKPVIWGGAMFAAPPLSDVVASLPVDPPPETPLEDLPPEEDAPEEPVDETADLVALARFATALQNNGQPLEVAASHPLLVRWIATGLVQPATKRSWGPEQAIGPPDTEGFGDRSSAWASATRDDQEEWLELQYATAVTPAQVRVVETYCPGALIAVTGFRGAREVDLWRGADPTLAGAEGGTSTVKIERPFPTNRLRIYLDSVAVAGWNEIDAVGMVDRRGRAHWAIAATASSSYSGEADPKFTIDRDALIQLFARKPALMKQLRKELEVDGLSIDEESAPIPRRFREP